MVSLLLSSMILLQTAGSPASAELEAAPTASTPETAPIPSTQTASPVGAPAQTAHSEGKSIIHIYQRCSFTDLAVSKSSGTEASGTRDLSWSRYDRRRDPGVHSFRADGVYISEPRAQVRICGKEREGSQDGSYGESSAKACVRYESRRGHRSGL